MRIASRPFPDLAARPRSHAMKNIFHLFTAALALAAGALAAINVHADCTPPPAGIVGWWKGDGTAVDVVSGNNGTLVNVGYTNGVDGQAFAFDPENYPFGTYSGVQIADSPAYALTNALTIEGWIRPRGDGYNIFWRGDNRPGLDPVFLSMQASPLLEFVITDENGNNDSVGVTLTYGVWVHVAAIFDGSAGTLSLYTNGVLAAQKATTIVPIGNLIPEDSPGVGIGNVNDGFNNFPFLGDIDEIALYNRALSAGEVAAIYAAGGAGKCVSPIAPFITAQPTNLTVTVNDPAQFTVVAGGTPPLNYQWNFNGTNLSGATNATLTLTNVQPSQAGNYFVTVSNLVGGVASSSAALTVFVPQIPPSILSQTPGEVVLAGSTVTFGVTASGSSPLDYFWSRNGALISGATNSSYTLLNAQLSDSGSKFSCLVTNFYGSASSTNVSLKVIDTISNDLCSGAVVIAGANYTNTQSTLKASSFGDPSPDCVDGFGHGVWYQFTAPAAGLLAVDTFGSDFDTGLAFYTGSCDALTEAACNDDSGGATSQITLPATAGTTYFILAGGYGSDAGNLVLHLNFFTAPAFAVQPTNISVSISSNASFSAALTGTPPISLQWYFNNLPLADNGHVSGSTNSTLNIASAQIGDGGNYFLVASNFVGVTTSSVAVLTPIVLPPVFLQLPASQSVVAGSNANFFAVVDGTPPFGYQWYFNGNPLADDGVHVAGSTTSSLNISNLTVADAGSYSLTVTNFAGVTNASATLTVLTPPVITAPPVGRSVPPGLPTTFSVSAAGIPAPSYQWQLNGTNIFGATGSNYTVAAVGTSDLGFYQVIASNSVGVVTSVAAQLTFGPVAAWGSNFQGESLPPPGLSNVIALAGSDIASFALRADGSIASWGGSSEANILTNLTNIVAFSVSGNAGLGTALRPDGKVVGRGSVLPPTTLSNIVSLATGDFSFGFALRADGTLVGWGTAPYSTAPAGLNHVTAVACGYNHSLALRNDGTVVAWGAGPGTNVPSGLTNVTAIAAAYLRSLALKADGTVIAWGTGTGTNLPAGLTNITAISARDGKGSFSLALRANGTVVAWGDNVYGETNPPAALSNLVSVAVTAACNHGLALVNDGSPQILQPPVGLAAFTGRDVTLRGSAVGAQPLSYQWLFNGANVSGATNTSLVISNIQFAGAGNYQLAAGNSINTALSLPASVTVISNGTLTFLGQMTGATNYQGSKISIGSPPVLGSGPLTYQWFFSPTNKNYTAVPGATSDTLALDPALAIQSGNYYVAVSNGFIQPPFQTYSATSAPVSVKVLFAKTWGYLATDPPFTLSNAVAIAVGNSGIPSSGGHYLALRSDGKISPWGTSFYGETNVAALSNFIVTAVAAGYEDSLALKSDGTVYAWGDNNFGETNVPATASGIIAIACGDYHDLAVKSDGTLIGWGQNTYAQTTNAAATNVVAVAAGGQDSLALRADGSVVAWGFENPGGQIPSNVTNVIAVACGSQHYLALRANGTVVGWGVNNYGQTTIPASWSNIVAIAAAGNHSLALRNDGTVLTAGANNYPYVANNATAPPDLANVVAIAAGGDHDAALFGARAPVFTVQPWNRTILNTTTSVWFSAKCAGVQPVSYQWQLNGANIPAATNDTLTINAQRPLPGGLPLPLQSGVYQLVASNAYGVVAGKFVKLTVQIPLGVALNATNWIWTTSGSAPWFGETNVTHDGASAAQSGGIGALQETILQTTVGTNQPGSYTFWWKVSSEQDFDFLEFRVNGIVQTNISGEVDWRQVIIPVAAGTNVLQWRYSKDATFDGGQDAGWVDQFAYLPAPPVITLQPVSQTVNMGTNVTFHITATGGTPDLHYQWRQNGNLVGGNSSALTMINVARAQDGVYSVTVTNAGGGTVSSNAILKVLVPQHLAAPQLLPNGTFQFTSTDANGGLLSPSDLANFEAQASTNLANWVTLPGALSLTNGMLLLQDGGSNYTARYYRIIEH
jgi:alpha-tubulin suppressor-like RCC1 family protein